MACARAESCRCERTRPASSSSPLSWFRIAYRENLSPMSKPIVLLIPLAMLAFLPGPRARLSRFAAPLSGDCATLEGRRSHPISVSSSPAVLPNLHIVGRTHRAVRPRASNMDPSGPISHVLESLSPRIRQNDPLGERCQVRKRARVLASILTVVENRRPELTGQQPCRGPPVSGFATCPSLRGVPARCKGSTGNKQRKRNNPSRGVHACHPRPIARSPQGQREVFLRAAL